MFFGFTHCPDVCPTTLATLAQVAQGRGHRRTCGCCWSASTRSAIRRELLEQYVHAFDPEFIGATGTQAAIDARGEGVRRGGRRRVELPGGDYTMDHSAAVFLLNDRARDASPSSRRPSKLAALRRGPAQPPRRMLQIADERKTLRRLQYLLPQHPLTSVVYSLDAQPHRRR